MRTLVATVLLLLSAAVAAPGRAAPELGRVAFPTSGSPDAQQRFLEGVLWLHSFEYDEAREAFRQAQALDPVFAMAYWGEAMTHNHPIWLQQDRDAALDALARLAPTPEARAAVAPTPRERDYLAAVETLYGEGDKLARDRAYAEAMRRITRRYPDDLEAAAFYALALLGTCHEGRDFATYMKAAAVAEEVFARNPQHPGAVHYLIHSYDDPVHAPLGLRPARVYARVAPAAPHAQHMPSHIFLALGMWEDSAAANERSWAASEERVKRRGLGADERGYHALQWLAYGYLQQGRVDDAGRLLALMREDALASGSRRTRWYLARMRATHTVETGRPDASALPFAIDDLGVETATADLFARGSSALQLGQIEQAREIHARLRELRLQRVAEAETGCHASNAEPGDNLPSLQSAEVMDLELGALLARAAGEPDAALSTLREAARLESSISFDFGPPSIVKPSHELLGELLLEQGRAAEAQAEFEIALSRAPGRALALSGRERARAGLRPAAVGDGVAGGSVAEPGSAAERPAAAAGQSLE